MRTTDLKMMNEIGNPGLSTNAPKLLAIVQLHACMQEARRIVFFLKDQGHNSTFGISDNTKVIKCPNTVFL